MRAVTPGWAGVVTVVGLLLFALVPRRWWLDAPRRPRRDLW